LDVRKSHNTGLHSLWPRRPNWISIYVLRRRLEDWDTKNKNNNNTERDSLSLSLSLSLCPFWRLGFKSQTTETTRSCQFLVSSLGSVVVMLLLFFFVPK
jgi:hypothetical protein